MAEDKKKTGSLVFAAKDEAKPLWEMEDGDEATYRVNLIFLHKIKDARFESLVRVYIQGQPVGHLRVGKTPVQKTFKGLTLDLSKPIEVITEEAGRPDLKERFVIYTPPKAEAPKAEATPATTNVTRFRIQTGRTGPNGTAVSIKTFDAVGKPAQGTIRITASQKLKIDDAEYDAVALYETEADGTLTMLIQVDHDEAVLFEHNESGTSYRKLLRRNAAPKG